MKLFGLLVDRGAVVGVGPIEEVTYGPEPGDFYLLTLSAGNDIVLHPGSDRLYFLAVPPPSPN